MANAGKLPDRFWSKTRLNLVTGCLEWTGGLNSGGYARFTHNGVRTRAHRLAYEDCVEPIPEGLTIDHLCRVRHCVNPCHLEPVTHAENLRRSPLVGRVGVALQRAKTHCPKGHPYAGDNLGITPRGERYCKTCKRKRWHEWRHRNHA